MICLKNEETKQVYRVNSEVQVKPFIRAGYVKVDESNSKSATSGKAKKANSEEK